MKAFEVMQELEMLDPNDEIYIFDSELGPVKIDGLEQQQQLSERESPGVWCFMP